MLAEPRTTPTLYVVNDHTYVCTRRDIDAIETVPLVGVLGEPYF